MNNLPRWFMAAVLILAVLGLLWWARGDDHHRGDDVGALDVRYAVTQGSTAEVRCRAPHPRRRSRAATSPESAVRDLRRCSTRCCRSSC